MKISLSILIICLIFSQSFSIRLEGLNQQKLKAINDCEQSTDVCVQCNLADNQNRTLFLTSDHRCVTTCPLDSFPDQTTRRCLKIQHETKMANNQLTCVDNASYLNDKTCTCPQCQQCPSPFQCPRPKICRGAEDCCCPDSHLYYETKDTTGVINRHCVEQCPAGFCQVGSICVDGNQMKCPAGFYLNTANAPQCCVRCKDPCCKNCDANGECIQCAENGQSDSSLPLSVSFTYTDSCQRRNFTLSANFSQCSCCKLSGDQCHCDYCPSDKCHQSNQECLVCPDYHFQLSPTKCAPCHASCARCFGSKEDQCILCHPNSGSYLQGTRCVSDCGTGFFKTKDDCGCLHIKECTCNYVGNYPTAHVFGFSNTVNLTQGLLKFHYCQACHENCKDCTGPGPDECLVCKPGNVLINGQQCIPESAFQTK